MQVSSLAHATKFECPEWITFTLENNIYSNFCRTTFYCGLTQVGECVPVKHKVAGSNPASTAKCYF